MKYLKSHFWYNKRQRNGIFFLLSIVVVLQLIYAFVDFNSENKIDVNKTELLAFQKKIDSLKNIEIEKRKPKLYPFNPNYITDYKGYQLGMSIQEIDRLHQYRKRRKFVNSAREFQNITSISDSLLKVISPFFKFPDWVVKRNKEQNKIKAQFAFSDKYNGDSVSNVNKKIIKKINVNTATFKEILSIPFIDYNLCKKIFEYRDEVAELQDISELKNIDGFPVDDYERIILYLEAK